MFKSQTVKFYKYLFLQKILYKNLHIFFECFFLLDVQRTLLKRTNFSWKKKYRLRDKLKILFEIEGKKRGIIEEFFDN